MSTNPRYDGKPLLRMIELYVLRAIGGALSSWRRPPECDGSEVAGYVWRRRTMARGD